LSALQQPTALMSVFHMHVENAEQVHASVPFLKPQKPTPETSRFKGKFGNGGGGVGDGVHAAVEVAAISRCTIQGMVWMERMLWWENRLRASPSVPHMFLLVVLYCMYRKAWIMQLPGHVRY